MPRMQENIAAIEEAGLRDAALVVVGGAPITEEYAQTIGADGYAADASAAVRMVDSLLAAAGPPKTSTQP
jgi:methanogenic corrinoid protein MtbC1